MAQLIYSILPMPPRKIVYIHPNESVKHCINLMVEQDIGAAVVIDEDKQLVGIVSERDIVRSCLHRCIDMNTGRVSDVVYTSPSILSPHDTVEKAMQVMSQTKRRHILIREDKEFLAILSIGDILVHLLEDKARVIEHLEHYIHN
ncbi:CBS domain-containing protein [Legionella worsleiensis]|uniref:CBS domain protein n=1 Tax=Legionella worsleiensis TaxID=45076 RepID=A0A0W1A3A0_9GAMM|nr:CBS domain-containing protein [Legionella worsleiensis]KTD75841.1 CBS domain protein [Legionella worsleiensis]STY32853.1 CBS domain protein [Legionella worsleiensis]